MAILHFSPSLLDPLVVSPNNSDHVLTMKMTEHAQSGYRPHRGRIWFWDPLQEHTVPKNVDCLSIFSYSNTLIFVSLESLMLCWE